MNNVFSFKRFGKLLLYDGKRSFSLIWWKLMAICLLWYAIYFVSSFFVPLNLSIKLRLDLIYLICFISVLIPLSVLTKKKDRKNVSAVLLPASNLEKFLSMILLCAVAAPMLSFCLSFVFDTIFTFLPVGPFHHYLWEAKTEMTTGMSDCDILTSEYFAKYASTLHAILGLFFILALAFFGNLLFEKDGIRKAFGIFFIGFLVFVLVAEQYNWFGCARITLDDGSQILGTDVAMRNLILYFRNFNHFVLTPILLVISYFKLKTLKY